MAFNSPAWAISQIPSVMGPWVAHTAATGSLLVAGTEISEHAAAFFFGQAGAVGAIGGLIAVLVHYLHMNDLGKSVVMVRFEDSSNGTCDARFGIDRIQKEYKHGHCVSVDKNHHQRPWLGRHHAFTFGRKMYQAATGPGFCEILGFSGHDCTGEVIGAWNDADAYKCLHTERTLESLSFHCQVDGKWHRWYHGRRDLYRQYKGMVTTSISEDGTLTRPADQVHTQ